MSDTTNPVPWLRSGVGETPQDGGCIMQIIDWIDRNEWTDQPVCVHPVLRRLAIRANDSLDDAGRQKLLDLAPRLMNTNSDDKKLSVQLAVFCARDVLPIFEAKYPSDDRPRLSIEAAEAWIESPTEENRQKAIEARSAAAAACSAAYAYAADAAYAACSAAYAYAADAAYAAYADAADAAAVYAAAVAADPFALLLRVLDGYDRLTGRAGPASQLDFGPVCLAMSGVGRS